MSVRKGACFSQVILIKQRIHVDQIAHEHRSSLNERTEKEIACLSVRNYGGNVFSRKIPLLRGRINYCGQTTMSLTVNRVFMWNVKLSNIGAKCL